MRWKENFIAKFGEESYAKKLEHRRDWGESNPEYAIEFGRQVSRKGGKYYERQKIYKQTGISGDRERVRMRSGHKWRPYKRIIAPESQLHHSWRAQSASYDGLALVEADRHMHGFIDVIEILEGEITLFTEAEVRRGNKI